MKAIVIGLAEDLSRCQRNMAQLALTTPTPSTPVKQAALNEVRRSCFAEARPSVAETAAYQAGLNLAQYRQASARISAASQHVIREIGRAHV